MTRSSLIGLVLFAIISSTSFAEPLSEWSAKTWKKDIFLKMPIFNNEGMIEAINKIDHNEPSVEPSSHILLSLKALLSSVENKDGIYLLAGLAHRRIEVYANTDGVEFSSPIEYLTCDEPGYIKFISWESFEDLQFWKDNPSHYRIALSAYELLLRHIFTVEKK